MNQASTKMSTAEGAAQMNTCWMACAIAKNTSCRTAAGNELTRAGRCRVAGVPGRLGRLREILAPLNVALR